MNIGEASKRTNLPVKTIRYYEEIGLLVAYRKPNGYRDYSNDHLQQLSFVKRVRSFGFSLNDCRKLLGLFKNQDRTSADVKALAESRLSDLKLKAAEIKNMSETLERLINKCAGNEKPECSIIDEFAHRKPTQIAPNETTYEFSGSLLRD